MWHLAAGAEARKTVQEANACALFHARSPVALAEPRNVCDDLDGVQGVRGEQERSTEGKYDGEYGAGMREALSLDDHDRDACDLRS